MIFFSDLDFRILNDRFCELKKLIEQRPRSNQSYKRLWFFVTNILPHRTVSIYHAAPEMTVIFQADHLGRKSFIFRDSIFSQFPYKLLRWDCYADMGSTAMMMCVSNFVVRFQKLLEFFYMPIISSGKTQPDFSGIPDTPICHQEPDPIGGLLDDSVKGGFIKWKSFLRFPGCANSQFQPSHDSVDFHWLYSKSSADLFAGQAALIKFGYFFFLLFSQLVTVRQSGGSRQFGGSYDLPYDSIISVS